LHVLKQARTTTGIRESRILLRPIYSTFCRFLCAARTHTTHKLQPIKATTHVYVNVRQPRHRTRTPCSQNITLTYTKKRTKLFTPAVTKTCKLILHDEISLTLTFFYLSISFTFRIAAQSLMLLSQNVPAHPHALALAPAHAHAYAHAHAHMHMHIHFARAPHQILHACNYMLHVMYKHNVRAGATTIYSAQRIAT